MDLIQAIASHSVDLWAQILIVIAALGAFLKGVETILEIIAPLTKWTWDDNLATMLGKLLAAKIFRRNNMALYIAGSIFLVLSIIWFIIQKVSDNKKKFEEAKDAKKKAIDAHSVDDILANDRRMRQG